MAATTTTAEQIVTISVRIPESLRDQLDALAEATERPRQYHALESLRQYVETQGWIIAKIQEGIKAADAGDFAAPERITAVLDKYADYHTEHAG